MILYGRVEQLQIVTLELDSEKELFLPALTAFMLAGGGLVPRGGDFFGAAGRGGAEPSERLMSRTLCNRRI